MEETQDKDQQLRDRIFNAYLATEYTTAETELTSLVVVRGEKYHENDGVKTTEFIDVVMTKEAVQSINQELSEKPNE